MRLNIAPVEPKTICRELLDNAQWVTAPVDVLSILIPRTLVRSVGCEDSFPLSVCGDAEMLRVSLALTCQNPLGPFYTSQLGHRGLAIPTFISNTWDSHAFTCFIATKDVVLGRNCHH